MGERQSGSVQRQMHPQTSAIPVQAAPSPAQRVLGASYSPLPVRSHSSLPPAPAPGHSRCAPAEGQTAGDTQVHLISDDQIVLPRSPKKLKDVFAPGLDFRVFPGWSGGRPSRIELLPKVERGGREARRQRSILGVSLSTSPPCSHFYGNSPVCLGLLTTEPQVSAYILFPSIGITRA